jgi:hypothetical protein
VAVGAVVWALLLGAPGALAAGSGTPVPSSGTPVFPGQGPANPLTPFSPQPAIPTQTATTPTVTPTASTSGGGLSGTDGIAIGIGALLVLGGISFFIWRDARKRAPVRQRPATAAAGGGTGPRQRQQKPRKLSPAERKRRKRGKAR